MKFVVLLKQAGEGCDYTIGCGYRYEFFEAKDMDDALWKVRTKNREDYDDDSLRIWGHEADEMKQAVILPAEAMVDALRTLSKREEKENRERERQEDERERLEKEAAATEREAEERANYERLKKKFDGR